MEIIGNGDLYMGVDARKEEKEKHGNSQHKN
jgi:hypothetical protein